MYSEYDHESIFGKADKTPGWKIKNVTYKNVEMNNSATAFWRFMENVFLKIFLSFTPAHPVFPASKFHWEDKLKREKYFRIKLSFLSSRLRKRDHFTNHFWTVFLKKKNTETLHLMIWVEEENAYCFLVYFFTYAVMLLFGHKIVKYFINHYKFQTRAVKANMGRL